MQILIQQFICEGFLIIIFIQPIFFPVFKTNKQKSRLDILTALYNFLVCNHNIFWVNNCTHLVHILGLFI
ncbi:ATP-dependent helicase hrq1 [Labeo rohita]|uniref:ATP-dependent helicase hrq1 n=1 Tax=Labeo rohita TaxID=84645 RepID=A0ABQ8L9Y9_LABRO|nr:ATP-dependent helicase hrq1 [Labeo rohita]